MSVLHSIEKRMNSFETVIVEIENAFPGKGYSTVQNSVLLELYQRHGLEKFRKCAMTIIRERDSKPFPKYWNEQLRNQGTRDEQTFPQYQIKCDLCMDTGFVFIKDPDHEVVAICCCAKGTTNDTQGLPRLNREAMGLTKPFPTHKFNPASEYWQSQSKLIKVSDKQKKKLTKTSEHFSTNFLNWWEEVKRNSIIYWSHNK